MQRVSKKSKKCTERPEPKPGDFAGIYPKRYCEAIDMALTMTDTEKLHMIDIMRGMKSAATAAKARSLAAAASAENEKAPAKRTAKARKTGENKQ